MAPTKKTDGARFEEELENMYVNEEEEEPEEDEDDEDEEDDEEE